MINRAAFAIFYINPLFLNSSIMANSLLLDLSELLLSFETVFWRRELICANFCSREGPVPKFSDLEVVALSLTAETESMSFQNSTEYEE